MVLRRRVRSERAAPRCAAMAWAHRSNVSVDLCQVLVHARALPHGGGRRCWSEMILPFADLATEAMCHVGTAPALQEEFDVAAKVGCGHVFGLLVRPLWPLAMM